MNLPEKDHRLGYTMGFAEQVLGGSPQVNSFDS